MKNIIVLLMFVSGLNAQTWTTGYITSWDLNMGKGTANYGNMPYQSIDLEAMTHVVMFAFTNNADGTLNKTLDWDGTYRYGNMLHLHRRFFNDYVHSKGKPIIATFFGTGGGGNFSTALNSAKTRTALIANMMSFLRFEQYDGFDLDIEPLGSADEQNFSLFVKQLSDSLKTGKAYYDKSKPLLLTCAIYSNERLFASISSYFDQINIMSYDLFGNWWGISWHNNAVYALPTDIQVGTTDNQLATVANKITQFIKAGIPRNKLGVGIDFNGYIWKGGLLANGNGITAPRQQWITPPTKAQFNESRYYDLRKIIDTSTSTLHYDHISKVPYIGIDRPGNAEDTYIIFQDTSTAREIMKVVRDSAIGGVILWEVNGGYLNTTKYPASKYPNLLRDPFIQTVKRAMNEIPAVSFDTLIIPDIIPATIPTGNTIYGDDGISTPWKDVRSWSVTRNYMNASPVYKGSTSMRVVHRPWGSLQFSQGTWGSFALINPLQLSSFNFALNGGATGVTLQVSCVDASNKNLLPPVTVKAPANTWVEQSIPMDKLAASPFTSVAITAGSSSVTFYLDEIQFQRVSIANIDFIMWLTGNNREAIEQRYDDWLKESKK